MSKTNTKRNIARDYLYFIIILICLVYFGIKKISKDGERQTDTQQNSFIDSGETEDGGICDMCGKKFTGRGYTEIGEGVWQETSEPYQSFICSKSCGARHTNKWNNTLNR